MQEHHNCLKGQSCGTGFHVLECVQKTTFLDAKVMIATQMESTLTSLSLRSNLVLPLILPMEINAGGLHAECSEDMCSEPFPCLAFASRQWWGAWGEFPLVTVTLTHPRHSWEKMWSTNANYRAREGCRAAGRSGESPRPSGWLPQFLWIACFPHIHLHDIALQACVICHAHTVHF